MTTLFQMAAATGKIPEYREMTRGYYPSVNERIIRSAFAALSSDEQQAAAQLPDGRYFDCQAA